MNRYAEVVIVGIGVLQVFMESSLPVIDYYEARGKVRRINANRSADAVYEEVKQLFL